MTTCPDDLLVAKFFVRRVWAVINVGGEVEKEGLFCRIGGIEKDAALSLENASNFVKFIGAVELFTFASRADDLPTVNPAWAAVLIGRIWNLASLTWS